MSTLSIPVSAHLEEFIDRMVKSGVAPTKAEVVRQALIRFAEDEAVASVLRAEQELKDGKVLRGNLKQLMKRMP